MHNLDSHASGADQNDIIEAKAMVAVGLTGDLVILAVGEGNEHLARDASSEQAEIILWPNEIPEVPGLYEFTGYSAFEPVSSFDPMADNSSSDNVLVHRGKFTLISQARAPVQAASGSRYWNSDCFGT